MGCRRLVVLRRSLYDLTRDAATPNARAARDAEDPVGLTTTRLDGRSAVAVQVRMFKADVVKDLGGDLSRLQGTILESAAQKWLLARTLADYIGRQPSLVTKKRQLLPVVEKYVQLLDSLERTCERLGLRRVPAPVEDLRAYVARKEREKEQEPEQEQP